MKSERTTVLIAIIAIAMAAWCASENRRLRGRLEEVARAAELDRKQWQGLSPVTGVTNLGPRLKHLEESSRGLGEVMAAVQRHFAKLHFAGEARNWDLARFEIGELEENLDTAAALRPEERGVGLFGIIDAFKKTQMTALKDAIEVKDRTLFRQAYAESILMCNSCHAATGRPFIFIVTPTNSPVANQRWEPPPEEEK